MVAAAARRRPAPGSAEELQQRAWALEGVSLGALAQALAAPVPAPGAHAKGWAGQLVELALGADPTAHAGPDFPDLGIELKTVPVGADGTPQAATFCCSLEMATADQQRWESSRLRRRLGCVLWLPVGGRGALPLPERRLGRARLWRPTAAEERRLAADWELLIGQVGAGFAGDLSALAGEVLQVRPKAAHGQVRTWAPGPDGGLARTLPLGFYLRPRFTAAILAAPPGPVAPDHAGAAAV